MIQAGKIKLVGCNRSGYYLEVGEFGFAPIEKEKARERMASYAEVLEHLKGVRQSKNLKSNKPVFVRLEEKADARFKKVLKLNPALEESSSTLAPIRCHGFSLPRR